MAEFRPEKIRLFTKNVRPYLHDYPDNVAVPLRTQGVFPVGVGHQARYSGLGDMAGLKVHEGHDYFDPTEKFSLDGLRGRKTGHHPASYSHLPKQEKAVADRVGLTMNELAHGEAFANPQETASAAQMSGLARLPTQDVRDETIELVRSTKILTSASDQSGLYASGLSRLDRRKELGNARAAARQKEAERGRGNIYDALKKESQ